MPRSRRLFASVLLLIASAATQAEPPNVVLIVADDQGWGDLGRHGNTNLATPNLDRLATQGASFDRFYVQPVCAPTRAELLTGRWPPRDGVMGVTAGGERLDPGTPTVADAFRSAGYSTGAFGKWHNGTQPPYHPLCRGFETYYGFTSGHWGSYFDPVLDRDGRVTRGRGYLADDLTDETIRFIAGAGERPVFALLAFNTPHSPMQVPARWWDAHADQQLTERGTQADREDPQHTRAALAMVENLDWNVGRLLDAIDRGGRAGDTIVVYLSDNGPNGHRYNEGLRGVKGSTDEGGVRSPLFVRWPGKIDAGRVVRQPAAAVDLPATLAELAGVALPEGPPRDGVSLAPLLRGGAARLPQRTLFSHWDGRVAAHRGPLVLDDRGRLYDLANDPGQRDDLAGQRPAEAASLQQSVTAWRTEVGLDTPREPRPFTVGDTSLAFTQLPARDATVRGGVTRSNRYFNCTYFTDWTSPDDAIVWDVDVLEPGRYDAIVYYTCPEGDEGSLIELRIGDASCRARVAPAHDPPLGGAKSDRVPRKEGDVKPFRPLGMGEIDLPAGRGELSLRATEVPGASVMDFRLLVLECRD